MPRRPLAAIAALALSSCATRWPADVAVLEGASQALIGADALQTAHLAGHGYTERESDCVIGRWPSARSTALYFTGLGAAHLAVTDALVQLGHPRLALAFQSLTIGWEGATVTANARIGVRF